jgi:regulatory protein
MQKRSWKAKRARPADEAEERERKPIDPEKARERTMQRAVKLLAAKPRSVGELRERLLEKEWATEEIVDGVLGKLREYGYLDDDRYAFGYASFQVRQKPVGKQRLQRALKLKKVDKETADEALRLVFEETPEDTLIDRAIDKRVRLRGRPETRAETKSLFDHLLRQGFSYELVIRKVRAVSETELDEDEAVSDEPEIESQGGER